MTTNYKVGIYLRLSREDEKLGESESISNQRELLLNYINDNGLKLVDEYIDDGVSGTTFNRVGFNRMIKDCNDKKINMIITKDTSRLGRDHIEFGFYVEKYFPEHNIRYVAVNDGIDTFANNSNNDMLVFKSAFNDMYVKDISNKLKSSLYTKKRNGQFVGAYAPYGYNKDINDKHKLVINTYEANIVKRIFNMFINGSSINKIKEILTYEHIKTPSISKNMNINRLNYHYGVWSTRTINDILKNQIYIGNLIQCKQKKVNYKSKKRIRNSVDNYIICKNIVEPLIDETTFNTAQNMFKANKYKNKNITSNLLLKGLIYCKECKHTIGFRSQKQKLKEKEIIRIYGNCNYWAKRKKEHVCTPHSIKYEDIENCILKELEKAMNINLKKINLMNIINKYIKRKDVDKTNENIIKLDRNIKSLNKKIETLYFDKLEGLITKEMYQKIYNNITYLLESDNKQKQELLKKINKKDNSYYVDKIKNFLKINNKIVINNLIDKIEIDEDKHIYIHYIFKITN